MVTGSSYVAWSPVITVHLLLSAYIVFTSRVIVSSAGFVVDAFNLIKPTSSDSLPSNQNFDIKVFTYQVRKCNVNK